MAVALEVGWSSGELGSSYVRMSKKRTWGEDHQKQLEMMLGKPFDEADNHTLDLLGGSTTSKSVEQQQQQEQQQPEFLELGADAPLPNGWEKRLDLQSGMVYFTNVNTSKSTYEDPRNKQQQMRVTSPARSLELLHPASPLRGSCHMSLELLQSGMAKQKQQKQQQQHQAREESSSNFDKKQQVDDLNKFDANASRLDLELNLAAAAAKLDRKPTSPAQCSSECPKWLLAKPLAASSEHREHQAPADSTSTQAKRSPPPPVAAAAAVGSPMVTLIGCKRCLMYVMISRDDPRCPRCGSSVVVDFPIAKRRRFDLEL